MLYFKKFVQVLCVAVQEVLGLSNWNSKYFLEESFEMLCTLRLKNFCVVNGVQSAFSINAVKLESLGSGFTTACKVFYMELDSLVLPSRYLTRLLCWQIVDFRSHSWAFDVHVLCGEIWITVNNISLTIVPKSASGTLKCWSENSRVGDAGDE